MPSSRLSPVTALQPWMHQWWLRMESSSRAWKGGQCWWGRVTSPPARPQLLPSPSPGETHASTSCPGKLPLTPGDPSALQGTGTGSVRPRWHYPLGSK